MKTLNKMDITEKARLFHGLFKDQIPELINCIDTYCKMLSEVPPEDGVWDGGLFGNRLSFTIVSKTQRAISTYRRRMCNDSKIFADELFSGNLGVFTIQCIRKCTITDLTGEQKIKLAIDLLF